MGFAATKLAVVRDRLGAVTKAIFPLIDASTASGAISRCIRGIEIKVAAGGRVAFTFRPENKTTYNASVVTLKMLTTRFVSCVSSSERSLELPSDDEFQQTVYRLFPPRGLKRVREGACLDDEFVEQAVEAPARKHGRSTFEAVGRGTTRKARTMTELMADASLDHHQPPEMFSADVDIDVVLAKAFAVDSGATAEAEVLAAAAATVPDVGSPPAGGRVASLVSAAAALVVAAMSLASDVGAADNVSEVIAMLKDSSARKNDYIVSLTAQLGDTQAQLQDSQAQLQKMNASVLAVAAATAKWQEKSNRAASATAKIDPAHPEQEHGAAEILMALARGGVGPVFSL